MPYFKQRPTPQPQGTAWQGTAGNTVADELADHEDRVCLEQFEGRLNRCLTDLGRLDYNLQSAIEGLLAGLDNNISKTLRGQLVEITEPALQAKMLDLAETLRAARALTRLSIKKPSYLA